MVTTVPNQGTALLASNSEILCITAFCLSSSTCLIHLRNTPAFILLGRCLHSFRQVPSKKTSLLLFPLVSISPSYLLHIVFHYCTRIMFSVLLVPLLLAGLQAIAVSAIPSISAVGSKFFYENGTQFYIKGNHIMALPSTWLTIP